MISLVGPRTKILKTGDEFQITLAKTASQILNNNNFECFAVGGYIRDILLGKTPSDIDLATNAKPQTVLEIFNSINEFKVYDVGGEKFGTVIISNNNLKTSLEITTYRKDINCDGRKATIEFSDSIYEDLSRRDFTINALAMNLLTGKVIDPYNGISHIKSKHIETVGNPYERFKEDYLRMLRACRFMALDKDMSIEHKTFNAIKDLAENTTKISPERVRMEIMKAMSYPIPSNMINLMQTTGLLQFIFPELVKNIGIEQNKHHNIYMCKNCEKLKIINNNNELEDWNVDKTNLDLETKKYLVLFKKNYSQAHD